MERSLASGCLSDFMTRLSIFDFKTVALHRAHNFFPEDLKYDVQSCVSGEFVMQSKSYRLFLEFLCSYEMNKKLTETLLLNFSSAVMRLRLF